MNNAIREKSFQFAVRIVKLCKYLQAEQREFTLTKQLLRCGTSIGANVAESQQAQSRADFYQQAEYRTERVIRNRLLASVNA